MKRMVALSVFFGLCCSVATAQPGRGQQGDRRPGQGFQQRGRGGGASRPGSPGSSTLERTGLKLGQALPDLTIYDDEGGEFRVADVKGKHTVIVFGCLT